MGFVESYSHHYAKEVVKKWLECDILNITKKEFEFEFSENIYNNNCVQLEYPIFKCGTMDSTNYNWNILLGDGINPLNPTYQELKKQLIYPVAIVDMVIMDNNKPKYYIEIYHKHKTTQEKINKLKALGIDNLYEIEAGWILDQIKKPQYLKYKRLI
jgi:hypothetical protein